MAKLSFSKVEKELKKKSILYALWDCESNTGWTRYQFATPLKKVFGKVITFDPRKNRFRYGPELMRKKFLRIIKENKPDYVFFMVGSDEMNIDTIKEINRIAPKTKTIALLSDEDTEFVIFSRYYALFLDYCMVTQPKYLKLYKKDGLKNGFPMVGLNLGLFKSLGLDKEYDVSFVGQQYPPRVELMRFLLKNGIKVKLWGPGWFDFPEFKEFLQGGAIDVEKYIEVMNKSKITLGFVKNRYGSIHISHRPFEAGASKAFQILDYAPEYWPYLKHKKEVVMFKNNEDLLKKIKFYLKNDKERKKVVENAYKKVVSSYDIERALKLFFKVVLEEEEGFSRRPLPQHDKSSLVLTAKDFRDTGKIKRSLKNYDYVAFSDGKHKNHKYKSYLQVHSLEKTNKDVSCCDYILDSKSMGRYLVFKSFRYFKFVEKDIFERLINLNQVMVRKDFFLKNLKKFKGFFEGRKIDIINEKNTAFVSLPLVNIELGGKNQKIINGLDAPSMNKAFQINFVYRLYSLIYRKRLFDLYPYKLLVNSIFDGDKFVLKYLFDSIFSKERMSKIGSIKLSHKLVEN